MPLMLDLESVVILKNGERVIIRMATEADVPCTTKIIRDAFEVWKMIGLKLSPMLQTDKITARHLLGKGLVAVSVENNIVGTFSLDIGSIVVRKNNLIFSEGNSAPLEFFPLENPGCGARNSEKLLVFKRAAVVRSYSNQGLGLEFHKIAEDLARKNDYDGMVLETVVKADWLYQWYLNLGYSPVGSHMYAGSQEETILMAKYFEN